MGDDMKSTLLTSVQEFLGDIIDGLQPFQSRAEEIFQGKPNSVGSLIQTLQETLEDTTTDVKRNIHDRIHGEPGLVETNLRLLQDCLTKLLRDCKDFARKLDKKLGNTWKDSKPQVEELLTDVKDWFSRQLDKVNRLLQKASKKLTPGRDSLRGSRPQEEGGASPSSRPITPRRES